MSLCGLICRVRCRMFRCVRTAPQHQTLSVRFCVPFAGRVAGYADTAWYTLVPRYLSDYTQSVAVSKPRRLRSSSSSSSDVHGCPLLAIERFRLPEATSGTVCRQTSPQLQRCLFFGTALNLSFSPIIYFLTVFGFWFCTPCIVVVYQY